MNSNIKTSTGLREQIAAAQTVEDVRALLANGIETYHSASFKTVRQWQVTATRRIKELEAAKPEPAPVAPAAPVSNGRAERRRQRRAAKQ